MTASAPPLVAALLRLAVLPGVGDVVAETGEPFERGHWIELRLLGRRSNRDGIGAEVRLTTGSGELRHATARTAGGYLSAGDRRVHLGLGEGKAIGSIEIRWPSGTVQRLAAAAPDRILTITEP